MSLAVNQADYFWADLVRQTDWYRDKAGSAVAERYVDAVEATLQIACRMLTDILSPRSYVRGIITSKSTSEFSVGLP